MFEHVLNDLTTYEGKEVSQHKEEAIDETVPSKVCFFPAAYFIFLAKTFIGKSTPMDWSISKCCPNSLPATTFVQLTFSLER
jgi:hypothetical protein